MIMYKIWLCFNPLRSPPRSLLPAISKFQARFTGSSLSHYPNYKIILTVTNKNSKMYYKNLPIPDVSLSAGRHSSIRDE